MRILVAGAHGKVGRRLVEQLVADGHEVLGTVRDPAQFDELRGERVTPVLLDVTEDVPTQLAEAGVDDVDAIIYSIGAGPGSGPEPKQTVDRAGSDKLVSWAEDRGVRRYVIVSSHGAHDPSAGEGDFRAYLQAKRDADDRVADSSLNWTIVRPGGLTEDERTGHVATPSPSDGLGKIPRADVAAFLAAVVVRDDLAGVTTELVGGETPIEEAVEALART